MIYHVGTSVQDHSWLFQAFYFYNGFHENPLLLRKIIKCVWAKNLEAVLLFVDFSKAFDSYT